MKYFESHECVCWYGLWIWINYPSQRQVFFSCRKMKRVVWRKEKFLENATCQWYLLKDNLTIDKIAQKRMSGLGEFMNDSLWFTNGIFLLDWTLWNIYDLKISTQSVKVLISGYSQPKNEQTCYAYFYFHFFLSLFSQQALPKNPIINWWPKRWIIT